MCTCAVHINMSLSLYLRVREVVSLSSRPFHKHLSQPLKFQMHEYWYLETLAFNQIFTPKITKLSPNSRNKLVVTFWNKHTNEPYDLATFAKLSLRKFSLVGPLTEVFVAEEILHYQLQKSKPYQRHTGRNAASERVSVLILILI